MAMSGMIVGLLFLALQAPEPPEKLPVPSSPEQKEAETLVRSIFKDDFAKRAPDDIRTLAAKLLDEGITSEDGPAVKYVLLRESIDLATRIGDVPAAIQAVDAMAEAFLIDAFDRKKKVLTASIRTTRTPATREALADAWLALAEEAVLVDNFADAASFCTKAKTAARSARNAGLYEQASARSREISTLRRDFAPIKKSMDALAANPADPKANLTVGRWVYLVKNDTTGLWFLSQGSDSDYRNVAELELAKPEEGAGCLALANAWYDLASRERSKSLKPRLQGKALKWYEAALPGLAALDRIRTETRIEELQKTALRGATASARGLVFWIEPDRAGTDEFREIKSGASPTRNGVTVARSGRVKAFSFDSGLLLYPASEPLKAIQEQGTMMAWINCPNPSSSAGILGRATSSLEDFSLWIGGGHLEVRFNYPAESKKYLSSTPIRPDSGWIHVGATWDKKQMTLYLNGKPDGTHSLVTRPSKVCPSLGIGDNFTGGSQYLAGLVAAVHIYNRTLSEREISQLHAAGRTRFR